ncbi:putative 4-hydroxy-2-oxoglutarate aldolase [Colletotrichum orbiculare MAFF 240422]|uniref:4-hydroxy-2-oxoglutarate aldolase n=2 Tax=Colletotrichum orbiculare species complex TaxID=2707354 RepID=N4VUL3_COLOR|nr:putative 4-hydroxy-2-oxoglutarate aldolase [Colletotrichum orbiculare MAFF 240422]TDZ41555.1 putative 4-hydroxy-2-oxoglutarate aldolase [Colletotrichum trifolii]
MAPRVPPTGVFVPVPTFFKPSTADSLQPKVDIETQVQHSIYLAKNGIRGLVLLGSTGEAIHLNKAERFELISGVKKGLEEAGFPDYPIQAGVLTNGIDETLEWLEDYAKAGAQWGLVLVPGYFGTAANQENIKEWYTVIANKSPLPILIYNYPGVTNNVLVEPDTYQELAQHPNIVGCKMSHGNVSLHIQVSSDPRIDHASFRVYSGFGQQLAPIVLFGAAGVIDGLAAFYPKTVSRLFALAEKRPVEQSTLEEVQRLQYAVSRAEDFIGKTGIIGIREGIIRKAGFGALEGGRLPLKGRLAEATWNSLDELLLSDIEKIEKSL